MEDSVRYVFDITDVWFPLLSIAMALTVVVELMDRGDVYFVLDEVGVVPFVV